MSAKLRISSKIFFVLYNEVKERVMTRILNSKKNRLSDNAIWNWQTKDGHNLFKTLLIEENLLESDDPFAINYLPKMLSLSRREPSITIGREPYKSIFFKFCDSKDLDDFIEKMKQEGKLTDTDTRIHSFNKLGIGIDYQTEYPLEKMIQHSLKGTRWWLYFYGYEKTKRTSNEPFSIVRLIFTILGRSENNDRKFDIRIQNTSQPSEHIDYKGFIDLDYCSEGIMVCNLKTIIGAKQLHIKFNVDKTGQSLYLGQYLNFEEHNEIISGSVILHKIPKEEWETARPTTFRFDRSDMSSIPKPILKFFENRELNFRKTPSGIFNLERLKAWKDTYDKNSKRQ